MSDPGQEILADDYSSQIESFSKEEREEILEQIDKISAGNRIEITPELFEVKPLKKGGVLPLVINILGLVVIAGGFFFANRYFQAKEESMVLGEKTYQTTEDSVVKELKKQAAEKLQAKQQEISRIQTELAKLDKESSTLKATMDSQIKSKEQELKAQMQQELEKERARLQSSGVSSAELEKKLKAFEAKKQNDINASLKTFKAQSEAALKEKEKELAQAKKVANQILEKANKDKAAIEAESLKKEAELKKQFEKEKQALTKQSSEAEQKLNELSQRQHNEQLILDQITSSYTSIINSIKKGEYPKAQLAISDLRNLLEDPKIKNLPTVYKRVPVENFILDSLAKEIKQAQTETTTDFSTLAQTAQTLINARANIRKGDEAVQKGESYSAERFYNAGLSSLPQVQNAVKTLRSIQAKNLEDRAREYLSLGDTSVKKGKLNDAVTQYRNAAVNAVDVNKEILSSSVHKLENTLNLITKNLSARNTAKYNKMQSNLTDKISALQKNLDAKTDEVKNLTAALAEEKSKNADLAQKLSESKAAMEKQVADLTSKNTALASDIAQQKARIETLNGELEKSSARIKTLSTQVRRAENKATKLQKELDDAVNQIVDLINS